MIEKIAYQTSKRRRLDIKSKLENIALIHVKVFSSSLWSLILCNQFEMYRNHITGENVLGEETCLCNHFGGAKAFFVM